MPNRPKTHRPFALQPAGRPRASAHQRGYNARWNRERAAFLHVRPLCASCAKEGHLTGATEVDHIIPHGGDYDLFWDHDNWQPLCKPCHSRKTASEDGGFGR